MKRASVEKLRPFLVAIFRKAGCENENAVTLADCHLRLSLRGIDTHGLRRVAFTVRRLLEKSVKPNPQIGTVLESPNIVVLDGGNGPGPVCARNAMLRATNIARERGIGFVVVRNTSHFLASTPYLLEATERGFIAFACSNGPVGMAITGSNRATIGNNPFGYGVPTGAGFPILFDVACSAASMGRIWAYESSNQALPPGWGLDQRGEPTLDPSQVEVLLPFADHKGYGISLGVELITGILSGGAFLSALVPAFTGLENWSHAYLAIDVASVTDWNEFLERTRLAIEELKSAPLRPNVEEVLVPGERAHYEEQRRRAKGIPIEDDLFDELNEMAVGLGVTSPWA